MAIVLAVLATLAATAAAMLVVTNLSSPERKISYRISSLCSVGEPTFERAMSSLLGPPIVGGNRITCLLNGDQIFPPMLAAVRAAQNKITFETYIYWSGAIGREMSAALAERAKAGVRVHVLLDWVGSAKLDRQALEAMQTAGVEVERYRPLRWYNLSRFNSRTHRKILVVDGNVGFIGGVGIADQWLGNAETPDSWRDSHFQLEGPAVAQLQAAFMDNWIKTRSEVLHHKVYFPPLESVGATYAQTFKSSPREGSGSVRLMYLLSIAAAQERILLANSYFVPDDQSVEALIAAAKRGVTVEIIVPGAHIDTQLTRRASRSRWGTLLEAGMAIYEYQPTMFHCKVMVVDRCWTTVGSTNFDNRSFRLNDEANLNVLDPTFAEVQSRVFEQDKSRSRRVTLQEWRNRPRREKVVEALAGLFRARV
jgi:cardiolipin synthase